jgi:hypothetical protein
MVDWILFVHSTTRAILNCWSGAWRDSSLSQGSRRRGGRLGLHDFALLQRRIREALPAGVLIPPLLRAAALSR